MGKLSSRIDTKLLIVVNSGGEDLGVLWCLSVGEPEDFHFFTV